jgi:hypothetical protein
MFFFHEFSGRTYFRHFVSSIAAFDQSQSMQGRHGHDVIWDSDHFVLQGIFIVLVTFYFSAPITFSFF